MNRRGFLGVIAAAVVGGAVKVDTTLAPAKKFERVVTTVPFAHREFGITYSVKDVDSDIADALLQYAERMAYRARYVEEKLAYDAFNLR